MHACMHDFLPSFIHSFVHVLRTARIAISLIVIATDCVVVVVVRNFTDVAILLLTVVISMCIHIYVCMYVCKHMYVF